MTGNWERKPVDRKRMPQHQGCANPDIGPRCPACRIGLVTHEPKDPQCIGHRSQA